MGTGCEAGPTDWEVQGGGSSAGLQVQGASRLHPSGGVRHMHPQPPAPARQRFHGQAVVDFRGAGIIDGHDAVVRQVDADVRVRVRGRRRHQAGSSSLRRTALSCILMRQVPATLGWPRHGPLWFVGRTQEMGVGPAGGIQILGLHLTGRGTAHAAAALRP